MVICILLFISIIIDNQHCNSLRVRDHQLRTTACPPVYYNGTVTHMVLTLSLCHLLSTMISFFSPLQQLYLWTVCFPYLLFFQYLNIKLLSVFLFSYTNECKWRSFLLLNCQDIEDSMFKREFLMGNFISIVLVRHLLYTTYKYHVTAVEDIHTETIHYGLDTITVQIIFSQYHERCSDAVFGK